MPPKVRELIAALEQAGFSDRGGKGSHRNFVHPRVSRPVTIAGSPGQDARPYLVKAVRLAIAQSRKRVEQAAFEYVAMELKGTLAP